MLLSAATLHAQPFQGVFEDWATTDGTQNFFIRADMVTDGSGNVYVAGATLNASGNYDLLVAKYNSDGGLLWQDQYDGAGNGNDAATAIAIDGSGNTYVTGATFTSSTDTLDVVTIRYNNGGTRVWLDVYTGADELVDAGTAIMCSGGNVYVGGVETDDTNGHDFLALKYNTSGTLLWSATRDYNGSNDVCTGILLDSRLILAGATQTSLLDWDMYALSLNEGTGSYHDEATSSGGSLGFAQVRAMDRDADGNIYLTGTVGNGIAGYDIHTVKIDTFMNVLWDEDYTSTGTQRDEGNALAVDASGNVYVGGFMDSTGQGTDFVLLMYDDAGALQWHTTWNDTFDGPDTLKALVVDGSGNITVTGSAWNGSSLDYHTIQYDNSGTPLWEISYNSRHNFADAPSDIALTSDGGIAVTGQSMNPDSSWSYVTVKYLEHAFIMPVDSDSVSTSLRFLANHDQLVDTNGTLVDRVKFYSNQCYPNVYMMDDTLSYVFTRIDGDTTTVDTMHRIDMTFGGNLGDAKPLPVGKEAYWNNYYLGHIPEGRPFVPLHKYLYMKDVWANIDVEYSSNQRGLKYYIIVHPGADPSDIHLDFEGQETLYVDGNDALVMETTDIGELVQPRPLAYSMDGAGELTLLGWQPQYVIDDGVNLEDFGEYDGEVDLVFEVNWGYLDAIQFTTDPGWSTYWGGSLNDFANDITTDANLNAYVVGETESSDFPVSAGAYQFDFDNIKDAFVGRFTQNYVGELWRTFLGGSGIDAGTGITHDASSSRVYICGNSQYNSMALVQTNSLQYQATIFEGFVGRLTEDNGILDWLTGYGGSSSTCRRIESDDDGNVFVVGNTTNPSQNNSCASNTGVTSGNFPICSTITGDFMQSDNAGGFAFGDGMIGAFNSDMELYWSTYFGGENDEIIHGLAIDNENDRLYVVGMTDSPGDGTNDFPLMDGGGYFQDNLNGSESTDFSDGFIARFDLQTLEPEWSTFFGGSQNEEITGLTLGTYDPVDSDKNANVYISGYTQTTSYMSSTCTEPNSSDLRFPKCHPAGSYQRSSFQGGGSDNFIARFNLDTDLRWSTYIGGGDLEELGARLASNENGDIYFGGTTRSGSDQTSPVETFGADPNYYVQEDHWGINDASTSTDVYVLKFNGDNELTYGTYFGGSGPGDMLGGIAATNNRIYLCGGTYSSSNFPLIQPFTNSYLQGPTATVSNYSDAFMAQLQFSNVPLSIEVAHSLEGQSVAFPNPTNGLFTLEWVSPKAEQHEIQVFNVLGHQVLNRTIRSVGGLNTMEFDLSSQASGVYLVKLWGRSGMTCTKIVKQ